MKAFFPLLVIGAALLATGPLAAEPQAATQPPPADELFRIGRTGIHCVRMPCPWRGIVRAGDDSRPAGRPFWTGKDLPALKATPEDEKRIRAAWQDSGCLVVKGRFEKDELAVHRIVGDC